MNPLSSNVLICPICRKDISKSDEGTYKCEHNHSFDIAKEHYVNFLNIKQKKSKNPGDSKEMVTARKDFLSKDYYKTVADTINTLITKYVAPTDKKSINILDIGCGSGYYMDGMLKTLDLGKSKPNFFGLDISKDALKFAGKLLKDQILVVASSFDMPFKDRAFHCMLSVFSPLDISECMRILDDAGVFIRVLPENDHLIELKEIIYPELTEKNKEDISVSSDHIQLIERQQVKYTIDLGKDDLLNLLKMTPHYWRIKEHEMNTFNSYNGLSVTISMQVSVYKKSL